MILSTVAVITSRRQHRLLTLQFSSLSSEIPVLIRTRSESEFQEVTGLWPHPVFGNFKGSCLALGLSNLKSVSLTILEQLAFNAMKGLAICIQTYNSNKPVGD